jgi:hypothetical protein
MLPVRRKNDILWKGILEVVFEDLLRFIFPDIDKELDLGRGFQFLDKELSEMYPEPDKRSQTRFVDKLVKVYMRNGSERWMLLHIEVQGEKDPEFARRMFKYYYRILDRYDMPVSALAIFSGQDGEKMPDRFEDHCLGTHSIYRYNTLCITDYPDEVLAASKNPFAIVLLAAKKALIKGGKDLDKELLKQKLLIAKLLYQKGFEKGKIKTILSFLHNYVRFTKPETNRIFRRQLDKITGKKNTMDFFEQVRQLRYEEAEEIGRAAEKKRMVKRLLTRKFSIKETASIAGVSVAFVEKLKKATKKPQLAK